ncbi:MAG: replicative DNA helicase [Actinobacteria bacterium]|nr:MAG: replicative DNA helicase [Actinomycetota bacterium]TMM10144.1 MAG: replicative DNA helicase [Actinomycetota bacterium]
MAVSARPDTGNVPPQNQEAEVSVLGAILLSEQALDGLLIDVKLKPEDFYRERHRQIFRAMIRLKEKAEPEPVDALTVCDELTRSGELEEAGGTAYVHSLPTLVPAAANARHYGRIVKEHAMLRRLLDTTRGIQEDVYGFAGEPHELLERAEASLYKIAHDDRSGDVRTIEAVLHDELAKLEKVSREGVAVTGTPSGFKDIDELTGGFQPGNLIVLAARPAMGKSALVTNIAQNAAVDHGHAVAMFSLEMSETELAQRFIAAEAKLNGDDLRKGRVRPDRWPKVLKATEKLAAAPLFIDDSSDLGVMELRAKARRLHARQDLGLVIVDYLQLMRPEPGADSRVEQVGQISRGLKLLARELNIPVIAVSQLSRAVESRPDKRPLLSDLRESGNIEQDSDLVMFIYRDEYYNDSTDEPGVAEVKVAKHRNGPVGTVKLTFLERYPKFANLYRERSSDVPLQAADGQPEDF